MLVSPAVWPLVGRRRTRSDLINGGYDRPVAPVARGVVAAQFWRIEPGGYASIEEKRIVAPQAVAKCKLIKVHPTLADDEVHLGRAIRRKATQIAPAYNKGALQYLPGGIDTERWPSRQERPARRK